MTPIRTSVAAVILLVAAWPASAQRITSPYEFVDARQSVTVFGGWILTQRGTFDLGPESGPVFGAGYNIRVSGPFVFDARISYFPTTREIQDTIPVDSAALREDPAAGVVPVGTADMALLLVDGSLRFDLTGPRTWHGLMPYVLLGVGGAIRVSEADPGADIEPELRYEFDNSFTGLVGGGLEWFLSRSLTIRLDARDVLWKVRVPGPFLRSPTAPEDEWVQNAQLTLGAALRF